MGGWGDGAPMSNIDLGKGKDREYLRRAIVNGWGLTPEDLAFYKDSLREAAEAAKAIVDPAGKSRELRGCVNTAATMVGQIQTEEHVDRKEARTDEGKATERVEVVFRNQIAGNDHAAG